MCGLTGLYSRYSNGFSHEESTAFKELLWLTQLRGMDSTGVVQVSNKGHVNSFKQLGHSGHMIGADEFKKWDTELIQNGAFAYGHCRAATKGTINLENAHPFYIARSPSEGITLVHNGTLPWQETFADYSKFSVDSEWMAHHVMKEGPEEVFARIEGPIATMWWDSGNNSFNVFRNNERPLFFLRTDNNNFMINSEKENIIWTAMRRGWKAEKNTIEPFIAMKWYQFNLDDMNNPRIIAITRKYRNTVTHYPFRGEYGVGRENEASWHQREIPFYALKRGLEDDFEHIFSGRIKKVEWVYKDNAHKRITTFRNDTSITHWHSPPYEENLLVLEVDPKNAKFLLVTKAKEGGDLVVTRFRKKDGTSGENQSPSKKQVLAIPSLKYKRGKKLHWSHKMKGGETVKHVAICSYEQPMWFNSYANNKDGEVQVGQKVIVEQFECEEGQGFNTVYGFRTYAKDTQDQCIEYLFYNTKFKKADIEKFAFWEGEVNFIRVADKARSEGSGNVIQVILKDAVPIIKPTEDQADDSRVETRLH